MLEISTITTTMVRTHNNLAMNSMILEKTTAFQRDQVSYMHDKIGLHRMSNKSSTSPAISLHLYSPPFAQCKTFCEKVIDISSRLVREE